MAQENIVTRIKKGVYGVVANVDRQIKEKEGLVGKFSVAVTEFVGDTVKTAEQMHEDIKESGGYKAAAKRTGKVIADSFKENVFDRAKKLYRNIESDLFTNRELDSEKVKNMLKNETEAVKKYGEKAYKRLSELVSTGAEAVKRGVKGDYHKFIPTDEDLKTKYAGIGGKYRGALFIEDYEACLAFRRKVQRKIPKDTKVRAQILEDIKASASDNKADLVKFYAWQVTQEEDGKSAPDKIKIVEKYLK